MSFKRDGSDSGLLSVLQKRRIKDLLAEDIPEDETKLLSNGRFTCLVCYSNPIFDTVDMLCVHRKGKKHKSNTEHFERKKHELKQLIAKRRHDQFVNTGSTSIRMAQSHYTGISISSPYDSRVKRSSKTKLGNRKQRIDLHQNVNANAGPVNVNETLARTPPPNNHIVSEIHTDNHHLSSSSTSTPWQKICDQQLCSGSVKHDSQLKNIFRRRNNDEPVRLHPYTSKHRATSTLNKSDEKASNPASCSDTDMCLSLSHPPPSKNIYAQHNRAQPLFGVKSSASASQIQGSQKVETSDISCAPLSFSASTITNRFATQASSSVAPPPPPPAPSTITSSSDPQPQSMPTPAQRSLALKYHHLQGSGWKRDWDGKWIKDEEAEFDSDEEPPDLP